jgi:adenosyl cobinamide kinase/adenosyl cobinamide phosphate guanylyltransferase
MAERVGRHRAERPTEWTTVEETVELRDPWDLPADPEMR